MLTYGRILAVPLVVLCFFLEGRLQSSDFARWSALSRSSLPPASPIISTAIWRGPGSRPRTSAACSTRSPTSCWWRPACCCSPPTPTSRRHRRLVAVGGDHHPVPRDPGLRPARISGRAEGQRSGHPARQVEDRHRRWSLLPSCCWGRQATSICRMHADRHRAAVDFGAGHALYRLRLFPRRLKHIWTNDAESSSWSILPGCASVSAWPRRRSRFRPRCTRCGAAGLASGRRGRRICACAAIIADFDPRGDQPGACRSSGGAADRRPRDGAVSADDGG